MFIPCYYFVKVYNFLKYYRCLKSWKKVCLELWTLLECSSALKIWSQTLNALYIAIWTESFCGTEMECYELDMKCLPKELRCWVVIPHWWCYWEIIGYRDTRLINVPLGGRGSRLLRSLWKIRLDSALTFSLPLFFLGYHGNLLTASPPFHNVPALMWA